MTLLYRFVRWLLRLGLRAFFREIEVSGKENVPGDGPIVLIANHHNGMIDPFLLIVACPRPVTFIAKAPLFSIPILGWFMRGLHAVPAYRAKDGLDPKQNEELYRSAGSVLATGRALGIFPEGKSHLDPKLAEFKHGASKIAFEGDSMRAGVRVQLVGIHFERTRGFRGKVLVMFGPNVELAAYRERYAADARAAVGALTDDLHAKLSEMVLTAENRELVRLADLVERMGVIDAAGADKELKGAFDRKKLILDAYAKLKEHVPDQVDGLRRALGDYRDLLDQLGVRDDQIAHDYRFGRVLGYALRNTVILTIGLPFMALGLAFNIVPYAVAMGCSRFGKSLDERTSIGFLVSIVAFPVAWAGMAFAAWRFGGIWGAGIVTKLAPVTGAIALRWLDRWHAVLQATWGLWTSIAMPAARARLRRMRERIKQRVERLIETWKTLPAAR